MTWGDLCHVLAKDLSAVSSNFSALPASLQNLTLSDFLNAGIGLREPVDILRPGMAGQYWCPVQDRNCLCRAAQLYLPAVQ